MVEYSNLKIIFCNFVLWVCIHRAVYITYVQIKVIMARYISIYLLVLIVSFAPKMAIAQHSHWPSRVSIYVNVDSIMQRTIPAISTHEQKKLYDQLNKCYTPLVFEKNIVRSEYLDSLENGRRRENKDLIRYIRKTISKTSTPELYIKAGHDYFRLHSRSKSLERYEEDSIITKLSLTTLYQGYKNTNEEGVKIDAINNVAEILYFTGSLNDSKELYSSAILLNNAMDARKCLSLHGYIRCHYSGTSEIDYETAVNILPYYEDMADIYSKIYADNAYGMYNLYAELGYISYIVGDLDFIQYCDKAIRVAKDANIEHDILLLSIVAHISYIKNPNVVLGHYYCSIGEYHKAIDYFVNAGIVDKNSFIEIFPKDIYNHIENNPLLPIYKGTTSYPIHLLNLANIYYRLNDPICAQYMSEALYYLTKNLLFAFHNYDTEGRQIYVTLYSPMLTAIYAHPDTRWAYNAVLFTKGITNNVDISLREMYTMDDGSIDPRYQEYLRLKEVFNRNPNQHTEYLARKSETELLRSSILIQKYLQHLEYTYYDVYMKINTELGVAIEFIKIPAFGIDDIKYIALILHPGYKTPLKVELCSAAQLREAYDQGYNIYGTSNSSVLYNLIWSKLEPYINEGDDVYFSPDGLLYQMNIEVLQDANGRRANEKWNLHRVSSTRELCMGKPNVDINSAALYGGLTYEMDDDEMLSQSRAYNKVSNETIVRGFMPDSAKRVGWQQLPATLTEIESISKMCRSRGITTDIYTAMAGNEESFKALSGKKVPIIHLATHGFFYKNEEVKEKPFFEMFRDNGQSRHKPDHSLKRSGLILAGGQKAWLGDAIPDNVEDGILLAEEIATMDLRGTDLVVLSACETGLGEITSEGVFGLQRAFKKAGVQTLIMSLWKVDDGATSLFMQTFYKYWFEGKTKHDAFAAAQQTVRENKDYSNPYYWAGFIMQD